MVLHRNPPTHALVGVASTSLLRGSISTLLLLTGCPDSRSTSTAEPGSSSSSSGSADEESGGETGFGDATVYDDCLLSSPSGEVPDELHTSGDVVETADFGMFTKSLSVYGITLVAKADVSDEFLRAVGATVVEMFPADVAEPEQQAEILRNLYAYRAVVPVFAGGESGIDEQAIESIQGQASICDIIMLDAPERQAMEVVEHLLHIISDVGLHHAYPTQWGMTDASALFSSSADAEAAGAYQTSSYSDIDEPAIRQRVILQEYAYWISTTYWDLQTAYGPTEPEWTARTPADLAREVPSAQQLIEDTIAKTMAGPSPATMDGLESF